MKIVTLSRVAKIDRTVATKEECKVLPYVGLENIEKETGDFNRDYKPQPLNMLATNFKFTSKHVLYGKLRPYLNKVALPNFDGVCTTEILPILPDEKQLDRDYLWSILISNKFVAWATSQISGANLPRLDSKLIAEYSIPLPALTEQRSIANVLRRADRLRRLRWVGESLSASLLQSVFLEMFYQTEEKWEMSAIEDLAKEKRNSIRTGPFGSQLLHSEFTRTGDILVLGIDNAVQNQFDWGKPRYISNQKYQELKRYTVFPRDLLITIMATNGRCAVVPDDIPLAINTKHLCCITLDQTKCLPEFLHGCFLYHPSVLKQMGGSERGAVMSGLNMEIIKNLFVPVPPIPEQERFAAVVRRVESVRRRQAESARQAEGLFQSLLAQFFGRS